MRKIRSKKTNQIISFIIPFISIIPILFSKLPYLSITLSIISLIISLIFIKTKFKISLFSVCISIIIIILNIINIVNDIHNNTDIYKEENLLLGSWNYNEYGGIYTFKEDNTYIQYSNNDKTDNYCIGTYNYQYGAISNEGVVIRQDNNYYYYDLTLNEEKCFIMNEERIDKYTKKMVFSINKENKEEVILMNKENNNIFNLIKQDS